MIRKSDWEAVHEESLAEERARLADPPTAEEVLAYTRGELSAEEEERVRKLLVCYPDLVLALTEPFPAEDPKPGHPHYLSEAEVTQRLVALRKTLPVTQGGNVLQFWRMTAALAATLALVFSVVSWWALTQRGAPRVTEVYELRPEGTRGGASSAILSPTGEIVLVLDSVVDKPFADYRAEIVDITGDPPRTLGNITGMQRRDDDSFSFLVPRNFLEPGKYQVILYGLDGSTEERLESYTFRVVAGERD